MLITKESYVLKFFKCLGFEAEKISVLDNEPAFFIIRDEETVILVVSQIASKPIETSFEQLRVQKERTKADICLVLLSASGRFGSTSLEKFERALYGAKVILPHGNGAADLKTCYYYDDSDFDRYRDILDGAILAKGPYARFCLNDCSQNYERLSASKFSAAFQEGVVDPRKEAQEGCAYRLDANLNRNDPDAIALTFKTNYKIDSFTTENWPYFSREAQIRMDGVESLGGLK